MTNRLTKNMYMAGGFIFFSLVIFLVFQLAFNFFAMKDIYMYDDENKYQDTSLSGSALTDESNMKSTYKQSSNTDSIITSTISFITAAKKWFFVCFLGVFLVMVFISKKNGIIPFIQEIMESRWK